MLWRWKLLVVLSSPTTTTLHQVVVRHRQCRHMDVRRGHQVVTIIMNQPVDILGIDYKVIGHHRRTEPVMIHRRHGHHLDVDNRFNVLTFHNGARRAMELEDRSRHTSIINELVIVQTAVVRILGNDVFVLRPLYAVIIVVVRATFPVCVDRLPCHLLTPLTINIRGTPRLIVLGQAASIVPLRTNYGRTL